MPFISIIVPVYNSETYLSFCIESILSQSFKDFELLLVDNNSSDKSLDICKRYSERNSRIKVFSQKKPGVSAARNLGLDNACGEYVMFVDSDDFVKENYISCFVDCKNMYPDCNNIWCRYDNLNNYNSFDTASADYISDKNYIELSRDKYMTLFDELLCQPVWNKLYKNSIIQENNIRMIDGMQLGEDIVFGLEYLDKSGEKIVLMNIAPYVHMNCISGSLTRQFHMNRESYSYEINRNLVKYGIKWGLSPGEMTRAYNSVFYRFASTMRGIYNSRTDLSKRHRKKMCRTIMKSQEFKDALSMCDCCINPLQKAAYRLRCYTAVHIYDKLYDIKRKRKSR